MVNQTQSHEEAVAAQISFSRHLSAFLIRKAAALGINLIYSPLCIHSLLTFLTFGTTGPTYQQLCNFLKIPATYNISPIGSNVYLHDGHSFGGPSCHYVGGMWVDDSTKLQSCLISLANSMYSMNGDALPLRSMPEECRIQINNWVAQATAGLIRTLFLPQSITGDTRLVLGNAIHFKGKWDAHFMPWTRNNNFRLHDGNLVETLFIVSEQTQFISAYDDFKVLKLPYEKGSDWKKVVVLYIFLPDAFNGLPDLWMMLNTQADFLNNHIPVRRVPVRNFRIPKFKIFVAFKFAEYLTELDLDLPFKMTGDSDMVDSLDASDYYVSQIAHACFLEVNEEGTEPTAASWAATLAGCSTPIEPIDFEADHPFVFFIREDSSGVVYFARHLLNPLLN